MAERLLEFADDRYGGDGPLIVLIVVCILFCFIWTPMLCERRRQREADRQEARRQQRDGQSSNIIRVSMRNSLNFFNTLSYPLPPSIAAATAGATPSQGLSTEDRREFIQNVLVSKKILSVSKQGPPTDDGDDKNFDEVLKQPSRKCTILLADLVDTDSTSKHISVEPCPICLTDYNEGEVLCWSQNSNCKHCFHRECMEEWLLKHEECPCCRHNYLALDGDEEGGVFASAAQSEVEVNDDVNAYLRGVNLFYLVSRLQFLADARPNTTIRLEGVELANGTRGNLEIQQATDASFEVGGRGLNVRITNEDFDAEDGSDANGPVITDVAGLLRLAPRPPSFEPDTDDDDEYGNNGNNNNNNNTDLQLDYGNDDEESSLDEQSIPENI